MDTRHFKAWQDRVVPWVINVSDTMTDEDSYSAVIRRMGDYQRKLIRQRLLSCAECHNIQCLARIETIVLQLADAEAKDYAQTALKVAAEAKR